MLRIRFLCSFLFIISILWGACASNSSESPIQNDSNSLIGEWEFLYSQAIFPDTTIVLDSSMFYSVYMIGEKYFNFFYSTVDKQNLFAAGRGSYLVEGNKYVEHVTFHSNKHIIGTAVVFDSKVENDIWIHEGYLPVREEDTIFLKYAKNKPTFQLIEVRRRIKVPTFPQ